MIELFPFQAQASETISDRFARYFAKRPGKGPQDAWRPIPFYQALEAITGAGKTAILADAIEKIRLHLPLEPVVLWLSKGRVVVDQTYANLQPSGKYHHLIDSYDVTLLADLRPEQLVEKRAALYFATVGTFNQKDKELGERRIFKSDIDVHDLSTWDALKAREDAGRHRRPLVIVYDEAQNLTDQQTGLLMELEPDAFLVASATMRLPQAISSILTNLREVGWTDADLATSVAAGDVVESGLIKTDIQFGGYAAPMERTIADMLADLNKARNDVAAERLQFRPKAIYVCKTNIVEGNSLQRDDAKRPFHQREAPPILIWRYLVEQAHVDPATIAAYCSLECDKHFPAPKEFILFRGGDKDYDTFTSTPFEHVIFNLGLQEGWDDPTCYFAYVDKSMGSNVQVEQLIGRVLRQPHAQHYDAATLNTAHFYIRVDSKNVFTEVLEQARSRISKEAPEVRFTSYGPGAGAKPTTFEPKQRVTVPKVCRDASDALEPIAKIIDDMNDYLHDSGVNTRGQGATTQVLQRVGTDAAAVPEWVATEHNNAVSARWVFARAVGRRFKDALDLVAVDDEKFDAKVEFGSKAFAHIEERAEKVVDIYLSRVRLRQRIKNPYPVGPITANAKDVITFKKALHEGYAGLNKLERPFAEELDRTGLLWARNPSRTGFGIPLLTPGRTREFYPDFLVWKNKDVFVLETSGEHLLLEKTGRKLLSIAPGPEGLQRLLLRLISPGRWDSSVKHLEGTGYTIWSLGATHELVTIHVDTIADAVARALSVHSASYA